MLVSMLLSLLATAAAPPAGTVTLCKHAIYVYMDANRKIFEGSSEWKGYSCSSGIFVDIYNAESTQKTASIAFSVVSADRVRMELRIPGESIRLIGELATDSKEIELSSGQAATDLVVHVGVSDVDGEGALSVDATNVPASRVVADAIKVAGRTIRGAGLVNDARVTLHFDAIPFASLMELLAAGSNLAYEGHADGTGAFVGDANPAVKP